MTPRVLLLALLSVPLGCKKEQPAVPSSPPPPAAAPATASARKDPLTEVPRTDSTLSLLEPHEGGCVWFRQDPVAQRRATVATVDGDCKGARLAWSQDQQKALLWFDPAWVRTAGDSSPTASPAGYPAEKTSPGATPRLYEVRIASGEVRPLPLPAVEGELRDIGYQGTNVVALSIRTLSPQEAQGPVTVDGQTIALPEGEGMPALAYAYRLEKDGQYKRVEMKGTHQGAGLSEGIGALDAAAGLGTRSAELLDSQLSNEAEVTEEQSTRLLPLVPAPLASAVQESGMPDEVNWARSDTPSGAVYVWRIVGDSEHTTGHLVFEREGQLSGVKELGFTDGDMVSVTTQGPFVLVSAARVGTHPRLYDLRTGKLAFRSDTARAATFWPTP